MSRNESNQIAIGNDWTQITDGRTDEVIQFYVFVDVCRSPTKPTTDIASLRFAPTTLTITAPDIAWIRAVYVDQSMVSIW